MIKEIKCAFLDSSNTVAKARKNTKLIVRTREVPNKYVAIEAIDLRYFRGNRLQMFDRTAALTVLENSKENNSGGVRF